MLHVLFQVSPVLFLVGAISYVVIPNTTLVDRLTKGKRNKDEVTLASIHASLMINRDDWKIDHEYAKFPREGATQILITRNLETRDLHYSIEAMGLSRVPIKGYFHKVIGDELTDIHTKAKARYLSRTLFDDQDLQILLEDKRK